MLFRGISIMVVLFPDLSLFKTLEIILGFRGNYSRKEDYRNYIRDSHESVENIRKVPYCFDCKIGTDEYSSNVYPSVHRGDLPVAPVRYERQRSE